MDVKRGPGERGDPKRFEGAVRGEILGGGPIRRIGDKEVPVIRSSPAPTSDCEIFSRTAEITDGASSELGRRLGAGFGGPPRSDAHRPGVRGGENPGFR